MCARLLLLLLLVIHQGSTDVFHSYYYDYSEEDVRTTVVPDLLTTEPNVALNGTTTQSSTYDKFGASSNAINFGFANNYLKGVCSHTDLDIEPWWMVDLKDTFRISFITVTNRGDCCNERIKRAEVRIGSSAKNGGVRNRRCATIPSMELGEKLYLNCSGMHGRYVTITIPGRAEYLTICQVQVFGVPGQANDTDAQDYPEESDETESGSLVTELKNILKHSNAAPNVALSGTSYQSSTLGGADHKKAIDGSLANSNNSGHCAHTRREMEPWWTVDLTSTFKVFSVAVTIPADCGEGQLTGAQIRVGNSANSRTKNPRCGSIESVAPGDTISFDCGEMEGRFVTVFIPGREEALVLCEVQVFGVPAEVATGGDGNRNLAPTKIPHGTSNLALKGFPSQSSNYKFYDESRKVIDGSLSSNYLGGYCSHTRKELQPWWMVDLRGMATIFSVAITNRGDCCRERINGAEIRIGNSRKEGGTQNPRCGTVFRMGYGETLSFNCYGMEGRYVTVTIPDRQEYLTICEVQVFGIIMSTPDTTPETYRQPDTDAETQKQTDTTGEIYKGPGTTPETDQQTGTTAESHQQTGLLGRSLVFPEESDSGYVILTPERSETLKAFTLCMRISTPLPKKREIILFSYRTQYFDALNLWREADGRLGFYLSGLGQYFRIPHLGTAWTHLCLTWESQTGRTRAYVNGQKTSRTRYYRRRHSITPGGIFMLGQDQDSLGGGFETVQSFVGEIRDLYMWGRKLPDAAIFQAFQGTVLSGADMFDWRSLSYEIHGNVNVETTKEVVLEGGE